MTTPAPATQEIALLDELANLGMSMARRLNEAALTSNDLDLLARIGGAFHQVSRGVRQTLALRARFAAGWTPAVVQPAPVAATPTPPSTPMPDRTARERPEATGWSEYERLDCDELLDDLDRLADTPEDEPIDFERLEKALEAGVARLHRGIQALRPDPRPPIRPPPRRKLLNGAAVLRAVNSS